MIGRCMQDQIIAQGFTRIHLAYAVFDKDMLDHHVPQYYLMLCTINDPPSVVSAKNRTICRAIPKGTNQ